MREALVLKILQDLVALLFLQGRKPAGTASSSIVGLRPGQEIQGTVVGSDGPLDLIDLAGQVLRAKGESRLPQGAVVRLRVLKAETPLEVRLLEVKDRPTGEARGQEEYLRLKAEGFRAGRAIELLRGLSVEPGTGPGGSRGVEALVELNGLLDGLALDGTPSSQKIRALVSAVAPGRGGAPPAMKGLVEQVLDLVSAGGARPQDVGDPGAGDPPPASGALHEEVGVARPQGTPGPRAFVPGKDASPGGVRPVPPSPGPDPAPSSGGTGEAAPLGGAREPLAHVRDARRMPSPAEGVPGRGPGTFGEPGRVRLQGRAAKAAEPGPGVKGRPVSNGGGVSRPGGTVHPGTPQGAGLDPLPPEGCLPGGPRTQPGREGAPGPLNGHGPSGRGALGAAQKARQAPVPAPQDDDPLPLLERPRPQGQWRPSPAPSSKALDPVPAPGEEPVRRDVSVGGASWGKERPSRSGETAHDLHGTAGREAAGAGKGPSREALGPLSSRSLPRALDGLKALGTYLDSVHGYHGHPVHDNIPFFLIPVWFDHAQGWGHCAWWGEEKGGGHGEPGGQHLFFDLDLKALGPLKIHIVFQAKALSVTLWAREGVMACLRAHAEDLGKHLLPLGLRVNSVDLLPLESVVREDDPLEDPVQAGLREGGFHKVT